MWLAPGGADFQFCSYVFSNCNLQSVRIAGCLRWNVSLLRRCFPLGSPQARGLVFRVDCQLCSSGLSLCRLSRTVAAKPCHTCSCFWGWCWLRPGMVLAFALAYHLAPQNYLGARSVHVRFWVIAAVVSQPTLPKHGVRGSAACVTTWPRPLRFRPVAKSGTGRSKPFPRV